MDRDALGDELRPWFVTSTPLPDDLAGVGGAAVEGEPELCGSFDQPALRAGVGSARVDCRHDFGRYPEAQSVKRRGGSMRGGSHAEVAERTPQVAIRISENELTVAGLR